MNHTIDTANGFKIEQRGVGHVWMHFMATREATGEGKSHTDLGTLKAWCNEQPATSIDQRMEAHAQHTHEWKARGCPKDGRPDTVGYKVQPPVGSTLQEIAEKGFAGWMGFDSNGWAINTEAGKE
jgi:hypothetical protein